ncbi:diguanylate cyclase [Quadrisphaera sp. INWT6]|uniref:GGDEF domain-containing protein n=1 Tax=Quadrisphaera sp. INWT6 TaxID=2596917 RepID=UPI0018927EC0|nr:diguanylate cyclase [Quadrisphaera sp. INWT6]MBF5082805.1 diguanylate cyclase [Quadrisphaera sp. INWT6]
MATRPSRGRAVWQHLTALVVVPLLAAAALSAVVVRTRHDEVERAAAAQQLLAASLQLDALRRAVDQEVLPTLVLAVAGDDEVAGAAGFTPAVRVQLLRDVPASLDVARTATDGALAAVAPLPATSVTGSVSSRLRAVRAAADQGSNTVTTLLTLYLQVSDVLRLAQRDAAVAATATGLTAASAPAVNDVSLVVALTGHASRELPLAFAAAVLTGEERDRATDALRATTGSYTELAGQPAALSGSAARAAWTAAVGAPLPVRTSAALAAFAALPVDSPDRLSGPQLLGMREASGIRDAVLTGLLRTQVQRALGVTAADRAESERALEGAVWLCVVVLVLSVVSTVVVARLTSRPLRRLSQAARRALEGEPLAPLRRGPREVREVGDALSRTAEGLHRVRQQAEAVARGDLDAALAQPAVPGRLGEVVQGSVEAMVRAVEARDALRAELSHRAAHDPLTGLPNRAAALAALHAALARTTGAEGSVAVLFVDLDGFKLVNDRCGHATGDAVLCAVAARLRELLRGGDVVARLGGDEFVVVAQGLGTAEALALGERLVVAVSAPVELVVDGGLSTPRVGASVGVALSPGGRVGAERLLREADVAVYRAKALGRGRVVLHDAALLREEAERDAVAHDLRAALDDPARSRLELRWEPAVRPGTSDLLSWVVVPHWTRAGAQVCGEALVEAAEAAGLGRELGRWQLLAATAQVAAWGGRTPASVRVTARHAADERLLDDVADALVAAALPAGALAVVVPETAAADPGAAWHLRSLGVLGVHTAVAGSGATPLQDLPGLPVRGVVLSADLVAADDPARQQLLALFAGVARQLGLWVVATGVETEEHLRRAVAAGADVVRGPLTGAPMTTDEAAARCSSADDAAYAAG